MCVTPFTQHVIRCIRILATHLLCNRSRRFSIFWKFQDNGAWLINGLIECKSLSKIRRQYVLLRHFSFKSWYVPAIQVRTLNGLYIDRFVGWKWLKWKTVRGMRAVMALRNLSLDKTFVSCLVGRSFATECFCTKHETFVLLRTWFIL